MTHSIKCPKCSSENVVFSKKRRVHYCEDCEFEVTPEVPISPLRIFLSYGHDASEELVRMIKTDLEKRGHDVWFDKSEIKFGDDWRRDITDGVIKSNRVLSFLSKHSTRDPGVCRDEIAIAIGVKGGNIQTILVDDEKEVQAPVNIGHIQWLDMHDWKAKQVLGENLWKEWYQSKFDEIIRVVESDESRRFAGEIELLNGYLKPIKSDSRIYALLNKGFIGREWLFEAVEKWRSGTPSSPGGEGWGVGLSRLFWITGDPGVGKSAFAAQLTHKHGDRVIAAQFVEWDKPDHRNPQNVIRSIAFQLATRLPDYRKFLLTLPEIKELERKNPSELFDYLLANPLKHAIDGGRERYLIVIDALDEAGESGHNPLVELLARDANRLPDWLGIIVTSRPESAVKTPLQGLNPFVLDTSNEANKNDIREYLLYHLAAQLKDRTNADQIIGQILEKSEGVFLYAERFCDDVRQNHISFDHPDQFPQGLGGIFFQYFQRQFPNHEIYEKTIEPMLGAILAAREPLPVEILQKLFNWKETELRKWLRILGSLFPTSTESGNEVIKPYHKSLSDWLADEKKAVRYFVSVMEGHRMLADLGWSHYESGNISGYCLSNFVTHLHQTKQFTRVHFVMCDIQYISALGLARYRRLPPAVKLWVPGELKINLDDEHGKPGDWRIIQYDGYRPPDSIWQTCTNCGCSPYYYDDSKRTNCPQCGWAGSEEESTAFISIEERQKHLNESNGGFPKRKSVFLSYSFTDTVIAERIARFLYRSGFVVWVDAHVEVGFEYTDQDIVAAKEFGLTSNLSNYQKPTWIEAGAFRVAISESIRSGILLVLLSESRIAKQDFRRLFSERFEGDITRQKVLHPDYKNIISLFIDQFDFDSIPKALQNIECFDLTIGSFDQRIEELFTFLKNRKIQ